MLGILLGLAVLAGLAAAAVQFIGLSAPELQAEGGQVSASGPLLLEFAQDMDRDSVERRLSIDGNTIDRFAWNGRAVSVWPGRNLDPNKPVVLRLESGARSRSGLILRKTHSWQVQVRLPDVVYLSPTDGADVWLFSSDTGERKQLSFTGGNVFDYGVSPDGSRIVYSVRSPQQGIDLWMMARDGSSARAILSCQTDWCINPAVAPDGSIAYSRRQAGVAGAEPGVPHIWLLDPVGNSTQTLTDNPEIGGFDPVWSPDGQMLAFFDGLSQGIRIVHMETRADFLLPSQMGAVGTWSPNSQEFIYTEFLAQVSGDEMLPSVEVYRFDITTGESRLVEGLALAYGEPADISVPVVSSDGLWAALSMRPFRGGSGKQLWLAQLDGVERIQVTSDVLFTHGSYHWDPTGGQLVFQRLSISDPGSHPQVLTWRRSGGETRLVAEDAFQARWLP